MLVEAVRGKHGSSKVRSGCVTCKRRRVRCDEARPHCQRCIKAKKQCEGYTNFINFTNSDHGRRRSNDACQVLTTTFPERPLLEFSATESEWSAFSLYIEKAAIFSGPFDKPFWRDFVLQLATQEPAIRHGVVALGSFCPHVLQQMDPEKRSECDCARCSQGLKSYNKALIMVAKTDFSGDRIHIALLACLLFIGIEMMRGGDERIVALASRGINLLTQDARPMSSSIVRQKLLPTFVRIRLCAALFDGIFVMPSELEYHHDEQCILTGSFEGLNMLRDRLFNIMPMAVNLVQTAAILKRNLADLDKLYSLRPEQERLHALASKWKVLFDFWENSAQHNTEQLDERKQSTRAEMLAVVKCYYLVTSIWLESLLSLSQKVFDNYTKDFIRVLDIATPVLEARSTAAAESAESSSSTPFTFEAGFMPLLFFVAYRCRVPWVRRRARALLELCPDREATWDKGMLLALAGRIIDIEEAGIQSCDGVHTAGPIRIDEVEPAGSDLCPDIPTLSTVRIDSMEGDLGTPRPLMDDFFVTRPDVSTWSTPTAVGSRRNITFRWFDESSNLHVRDETLTMDPDRDITTFTPSDTSLSVNS